MALLEKMSDLRQLRLETERLVLRPFDPGDVDRLVDLVGDYEVAKWLAQVPWPYRRDHAEDWISMTNDSGASHLSLAIDDGDGVIGGIGFAAVQVRPDIGYWLGRPYWGRGLMTEAVNAMLAFAFDDLDVEDVVSGVFDHNIASLRLQERFGFKVTGPKLFYSLARANEVPGFTTALSRDDFETFREPPVDHSLTIDP